ncbi:unnamed protein product, partial [Mesorhabditis belari]|uniref:Uncharacterized protein n=1 Tax=Mesorhabditis belari TaxID=2138241 RepID=A0AAF3EX61_9BILA
MQPSFTSSSINVQMKDELSLTSSTSRKGGLSPKCSQQMPPEHKKATTLKFTTLDDQRRAARVQLVLCNAYERPVFFTLKCSSTSISATPAGSGNIAAKSQARLFLTWQLPSYSSNWNEISSAKILLITNFRDQSGSDGQSPLEDRCSTRLTCFVNEDVVCNGSNPPTKQLILDALAKQNESRHGIASSSDSERWQTIDVREVVNAISDFYFQLSPGLRAVVIAILVFITYSILGKASAQGENNEMSQSQSQMII